MIHKILRDPIHPFRRHLRQQTVGQAGAFVRMQNCQDIHVVVLRPCRSVRVGLAEDGGGCDSLTLWFLDNLGEIWAAAEASGLSSVDRKVGSQLDLWLSNRSVGFHFFLAMALYHFIAETDWSPAHVYILIYIYIYINVHLTYIFAGRLMKRFSPFLFFRAGDSSGSPCGPRCWGKWFSCRIMAKKLKNPCAVSRAWLWGSWPSHFSVFLHHDCYTEGQDWDSSGWGINFSSRHTCVHIMNTVSRAGMNEYVFWTAYHGIELVNFRSSMRRDVLLGNLPRYSIQDVD